MPSVIDDIDMGVTHVVRGEDHVSNTAVQMGMFAALGATPPIGVGRHRHGLGHVLRHPVGAAVQLDDAVHDMLRADLSLTDAGVQRRHIRDMQVLGDRRQRVVVQQPLQR